MTVQRILKFVDSNIQMPILSFDAHTVQSIRHTSIELVDIAMLFQIQMEQ